MTERARYARILTILGYLFMIFSFLLFAIPPMFGKSIRYITNITDPVKPLPFQTYYFYDKDRSPNFELTFVAQMALALISAVSYSGVDNLFGLLVFHLCGQLENLKERLSNLRKFKTFNSDPLTFIVMDHLRLIKFCIENSKLKIMSILIFSALF